MQETNENIDRTIELSRHLLNSADLSDISCENRDCHNFYRNVSDKAGRIIKEAERERLRNKTPDFPETRKNQGLGLAFSGLRSTSWKLWLSAKSIFKKNEP
jgi:hypothetical protein